MLFDWRVEFAKKMNLSIRGGQDTATVGLDRCNVRVTRCAVQEKIDKSSSSVEEEFKHWRWVLGKWNGGLGCRVNCDGGCDPRPCGMYVHFRLLLVQHRENWIEDWVAKIDTAIIDENTNAVSA